VLSQAISYLSWLDSAHHEVEALVRQVLGAEAVETIDWRRPRIVCIAANFLHHDRVAVQRLSERINLVRNRLLRGRPAEPAACGLVAQLDERYLAAGNKGAGHGNRQHANGACDLRAGGRLSRA
jgi:hypothetical protein